MSIRSSQPKRLRKNKLLHSILASIAVTLSGVVVKTIYEKVISLLTVWKR